MVESVGVIVAEHQGPLRTRGLFCVTGLKMAAASTMLAGLDESP